MTIQSHHARLLGSLLAVVGLAPLCTIAVACSGGVSSGAATDAGDEGRDFTRNCGGAMNFVKQTTGPLCKAGSGDAGDASDASDADASTQTDAEADPDAGDAGATDGGACFATCAEACKRAFPDYAFPSSGVASTCDVVVVGQNEQITCRYTYQHPCGRGFAELVVPPHASRSTLGALFARAAWMEAASITAFRRLARELLAHGAPAELVRAAYDAARDEVRHARAMGRLARRYGAEIPRVEHAPLVARSLEELAIENAREACVGETYGAAVAAWQAKHACDLEVREAMASIAGDELRHAAFGHALADWVATKLSASARGRVAAATRDALADLARQAVLGAPAAEVVREAGMPAPRDALRLAAAVSAMAA